MLTQQTIGDFDIVGDLATDVATDLEYAPYLVLASLLLWALILTLRTRKPSPRRQPTEVDESEKIETDEQLATPATLAAGKRRYVDADARPVLASREATLATVAVAAADDRVEEPHRAARQVQTATDRPDPFYDSLGFGIFVLAASFAAMAFVLGWKFPGVEAVFNFTAAGWWIVGILVALTIPAIVRIARRQEGAERFLTATAGVAGSAAIAAAAISFFGLGIASTPLVALWTHPEPQRQTIVSTETIVPSSLTIQSDRFGFFLGGTGETVSGLVETDDGIRTFAASSYRYGDEWQLVTEEICTTTVYTSPLLIQDTVDDEQCFTQTTAVLGAELPAH